MLKFQVESLDGVGEQERNFYTEKDGSYQLNVDLTGSGYEKVDGLKSALSKIKEERNGLKEKVGKLSKFESLLDVEGFDPSNIDELMTKAQGNGDSDQIEKLERQYKKQIDVLNQKVSTSEEAANNSAAKMNKYIIQREISEAAIKAGVSKDSIDDVVALTYKKFSLDEKNRVQVIDDDGDSIGITPTEFFSGQYKEAKPRFYDAVSMKGSNSRSTSSVNKGQQMSSKDKIVTGLTERN